MCGVCVHCSVRYDGSGVWCVCTAVYGMMAVVYGVCVHCSVLYDGSGV